MLRGFLSQGESHANYRVVRFALPSPIIAFDTNHTTSLPCIPLGFLDSHDALNTSACWPRQAAALEQAFTPTIIVVADAP